MYMQIPQVPEQPLPSCPRCGKASLVKCTNEDVYCCLNCTFRKDLNRSYWDASSLLALFSLSAVIAVISFSLLNAWTATNPSSRENTPRENTQVDSNRQQVAPRTPKNKS